MLFTSSNTRITFQRLLDSEAVGCNFSWSEFGAKFPAIQFHCIIDRWKNTKYFRFTNWKGTKYSIKMNTMSCFLRCNPKTWAHQSLLLFWGSCNVRIQIRTVIWLLVVTDGGVKILWGEIKTLLILLTILSICFWIFYAQSSYLKIAFETPFSSLIFAMGELFAFKVQKCHIWNRSSWTKMSQKHFKWYQWCGVLFNGFKIDRSLQLILLACLICSIFIYRVRT